MRSEYDMGPIRRMDGDLTWEQRMTQFAHLGIPRKFLEKKLEDYAENIGEDNYANVRLYVREVAAMRERGLGLLLTGPYGVGKTGVACEVLKHAIRCGYATSRFTTFSELLKMYTDGWRDEEQRELYRKFQECDFLCLDEFGNEHRGRTDFVSCVMNELVRHRTNERLPTVFTSNIREREIEELYGATVSTILFGPDFWVLDFRGGNYRQREVEATARWIRELRGGAVQE